MQMLDLDIETHPHTYTHTHPPMFRRLPEFGYGLSDAATIPMRLTTAFLDRLFEEVVTFQTPDPVIR